MKSGGRLKGLAGICLCVVCAAMLTGCSIVRHAFEYTGDSAGSSVISEYGGTRDGKGADGDYGNSDASGAGSISHDVEGSGTGGAAADSENEYILEIDGGGSGTAGDMSSTGSRDAGRSESSVVIEDSSGDGGEDGTAAKSAEYAEDEEAKEEMDLRTGEDTGGTAGDGTDKNERDFTMAFAGDVLFQSNITAAYDSGGIGGILSPDLLKEMQEADVAMVNQEFPFAVGGEQAPDKQYTFKADPSYAAALAEMGVDIVTLANNHVLDYGRSALSENFAALTKYGIAYVGAGETLERAMAWETFNYGELSVAVLGASRVIPVVDWDVRNSQPGVFTTYDASLLTEQIRLAKAEHDLVIVYVHWGIEKATSPEDYQRQLAKAYIDAGADLVIGAHPHVLQGIEYYNGVPIVYSLGNFMFHETISQTALLKAVIGPDGELSINLIPAAASGSRTYAQEGEKAQAAYRYIESISFGISIDEDGWVHEEQ